MDFQVKKKHMMRSFLVLSCGNWPPAEQMQTMNMGAEAADYDVMVTALRHYKVYLKEALGIREREGRRNAYFLIM